MHRNQGTSWQFEIFANFCRIIPPEMEVYTCEMGELCLTCPHVDITLEKTHVPDFPLEAFQNFELYLVPNVVDVGTG
jgi:hypothetical protein